MTRLPPWYVIQGYTEGCWKYHERTFKARRADAGNLSPWHQLYLNAGGTMQDQSPPQEAGERTEQPEPRPALAVRGISAAYGETQARGTAGEVPGLIRARRACVRGGHGHARRAVAAIAAVPPLIAAAVALAIVLAAATTVIVVENGGTGHPPAARADKEIPGAQPARLRVPPLSGHARILLAPIQVPLTGQLADILGWSRATSARTVTGYEFRNDGNNSAPVCLGALTIGADAGEKHDPVRALSCTRAPNQIWVPVQWDRGHQNLTWLVNDQYPSRCLNVNKALGDGSAAQLWDCYHNPSGLYGLAINEAWDFGDWYANMTSAVNPFPLFLGMSDFCLDTGSQGADPSKGSAPPDGADVDIKDCSSVAATQYWS